MSPAKYPVCSGLEVIKALSRFGYERTAQKGSHVKLKKTYQTGDHIIVVPLHKELDRGTLASIIKRVKKFISEEEFLKVLKKSEAPFPSFKKCYILNEIFQATHLATRGG